MEKRGRPSFCGLGLGLWIRSKAGLCNPKLDRRMDGLGVGLDAEMRPDKRTDCVCQTPMCRKFMLRNWKIYTCYKLKFSIRNSI